MEEERIFEDGEGKKAFCCTSMFSCVGRVLYGVNQQGFFPFSFHAEEVRKRREHYKATAVWSALVSFTTMAIFLGVEGFRKVHDAEHKWYDNLDDMFHRLAAILTLAVCTFAVASVSGALHYCFKRRPLKNNFNKLFRDSTEDQSSYGSTPMLREYEEDVDVVNSQGQPIICHPARLCAPSTPVKTFFWGAFLAGATITLIFSIRPDYFERIVQSEFAHYGAVITAGIVSAAVVSGLFTGLHYAGAKIHDCIDSEKVTYTNAPDLYD